MSAMRVQVRFLGIFRDLTDGPVGVYELADDADVAGLIAEIERRHAEMARVSGQYRVMVNGMQSTFDQRLGVGDEIAVLGPIGGG